MMKHHIPIEYKKHYHFSFGPDELLKMVGLQRREGEKALSQIMDKDYMSTIDNKIYCENVLEIQKEVDFARRIQERELKLRQSKRRFGIHA